MLQQYEQKSRAKLAATILTVLVVASAVVFADHLKAQQLNSTGTHASSGQTSSQTTPASQQSSGTATSTSGNKDGSYSARSSYYVPHGSESIGVDLTLENGVIPAVSINNSENNFDSAQYQQEFASVYKSYVVGKKISSLQIGNIAGASDTTQGFNDALRQIATKAQA